MRAAYSLMYHDVVEPGDFAASGFDGGDADIYKLERPHFRDHLEAIGAAADAAGAARTPSPAELAWSDTDHLSVILHFDDGGASALAIADDLEGIGWRGYFHITTDRIGTAGFVSAGDVRALHARGHFVGSHSHTHPARISKLPPAEILGEWRDSVAILADLVGDAIVVASVPGGFCSPGVIDAADRAGIEFLFNSEPVASFDWVRGCLVLGRYSIKQSTSAAEAAAIAAGNLRPRLHQWALWNGKKVLKQAGGEAWLAARRRILRR